MFRLLLHATALGILYSPKTSPTVAIEMALEKYFDYSFLMAVLCSGDVLRFLVIRGTTQNPRSTDTNARAVRSTRHGRSVARTTTDTEKYDGT